MKRLVLALMLVTYHFIFSSEIYAAGMQVKGSLPRSLETGAFSLEVIVTGVFPSDLTAGRGEATQSRISIELTQIDQAPLGFDQTRAQTANARFYIQERLVPQTLPDINGNFTITTYLWIREAIPGELKRKITNGKINLRLNYSIAGKNVVRDFLAELSQDAYVINEAPSFAEGTAVVGSQKSLLVNFNVKSSVAAKGGDSASKEPINVNMYVVDSTVAGSAVSLPAKRFSGQASTPDTDATCTFRMPSEEMAACVSDCVDSSGATGDIYLNDVEIANIPGFTVTSVSASSGQGSVVGLENGKRYYTFLQYEPDGTQVSACLAGEPSANMSLTELNGEGEAKVVDIRCFIASAAYGSPLHEKLRVFRKFRDRILLQSPVGRTFVDLYYELSPPIAAWLNEHPKARTWVRRGLEVPASILGAFDNLY